MFKRKKKLAIVIDTNMILRIGEIYGGDFVKKLKGAIFVPWAVLEELLNFKRIAIKERRINAKRSSNRSKAVLNVWKYFKEQIEKANWRIIGSDSKTFFKINKKIGSSVGNADVRIVACCKVLIQEKKFKEVVLLTKDKILREKAADLGIKTKAGLSNLVKK